MENKNEGQELSPKETDVKPNPTDSGHSSPPDKPSPSILPAASSESTGVTVPRHNRYVGDSVSLFIFRRTVRKV